MLGKKWRKNSFRKWSKKIAQIGAHHSVANLRYSIFRLLKTSECTSCVHCHAHFNQEYHPTVRKPNSWTQPSALHGRFNYYLDTHQRVLVDIARSFRYSHQHAPNFRASGVEYPLISCFCVGIGIVLRGALKLKRRITAQTPFASIVWPCFA